MNNLIVSKLFTGLESIVKDNKFKIYGMPSFSYFMKKIEKSYNCHLIFLVRKELFFENKFIIKKKIHDFDKEIIFINESYFLKKKRFKIFFKIINSIFKFVYLLNFVIKKNIKNLKLDASSLVTFYFISRIKNFKKNLRLYGSYTLNFQKDRKDIYSYFFRRACKMKFNSVICTKDGNSDLNDIKKIFINTKKVEIPFNGSNFINFNSKANYNLDKSLIVLFIGRLNHLKGPLHLLEAIKKLIKKNIKNINLTIIGTGEQMDEVLRYIKVNRMMANVRFHKKLDHLEIRNKMRNSDVLVSPSFIGYFSNVVLEATSMGLPVMTCDDKYNIINNCNFKYLQNKYSFRLNNKSNLSDQIYKNLIKVINNPSKLFQMSNLEKKISKKYFRSWKQIINDEIKLTDLR